MTWTIDKSFSCCYGHRVWVQRTNVNYTLDNSPACKCRHLHGHEGLIHVFLNANKLNDQGMVTDFLHLGWLKNFIDDTIDHKFIIDFNDPMFRSLVVDIYETQIDNSGTFTTVDHFIQDMTNPVYVPGTDILVGYKVNMEGLDSTTPEYEILQGYLIVEFVPTSENLSEWMWGIVQSKMQKLNVNCSRVDWFETPKSRASYSME